MRVVTDYEQSVTTTIHPIGVIEKPKETNYVINITVKPKRT